MGLGRFDEALAAARRGKQLGIACGNPNAIAWALAHEGAFMEALEDPAAAAILEQGLRIAEEVGAVVAMTQCQRYLAGNCLRVGRLKEAARHITGSLQSMRRKGAGMFLRQSLFRAVAVLTEGGSVETAAVVFDAVRSSSAAGSLGMTAWLARLHDRLATTLGPERLEELAMTGEALTAERAARLAEDALANLVD